MSAPSFSSFPPSFSSFPDPVSKRERTPRQSKSRQGPPSDDSLPHERDCKSSRSSVRHSTEKRVQYRYSEDEATKIQEDQRQEHTGSSTDWGFYSDRKGDPLNVTYGGLHAGDVPKYHVVGRGKQILGLGEAYTIAKRTDKAIEVVTGVRRSKLLSLEDSRSKAILDASPRRRLFAIGDTYKYPEVDGFLRIAHKSMRDEPSNCTINDKNEDSDTTPSSDTSGDYSKNRSLTTAQLAIKNLEGELLLHPSSESRWLSLVSHSLSLVPYTTKNSSHARAEIKVSILNRALQASPSNAHNQALRLHYLRAGQQVWHESKLRAEWESALQSGNIDLWMEWFEWRLHMAKDNISGIVQDANRILTALGDEEHAEVSKLRVVWRAAVAWQQAGLYERATALFQAQAELLFQMPMSLVSSNQSFDTCLDSLEEFWDAEVPRMGELGAKGWASWVATGRLEVFQNSPDSLVRLPQRNQDPFVEWYNGEVAADETLRNPAHTVDPRSESDAYATVLFSDIRPLLIRLTSERSKTIFRFIWLSLLGLHIPGLLDTLSVGSWDDRWATRPPSTTFMDAVFPHAEANRVITSGSQAGVIIGRERTFGSTFGPIKEWAFGTFHPLDYTGKERWRMWNASDIVHVEAPFVRRVFQQLRLGSDDYQWDDYALAFEASISTKSAIKLSRSFLANAKESIPRWLAHAKLEQLQGRHEEARRVYQMVIISEQVDTGNAAMSQLWWDWAEMEWLQGNSNASLEVIMQSVNVPGSTSMAVLRAKRRLNELISSRHQGWLQLRALLELITSSPEAALNVFDAYLADSGRTSDEGMTVASLLLLYHHSVTLRNKMPPSLLRGRLSLAIQSHPSNTIIMGMFLECEKGFGVWGRIRGMYGEGAAYSTQNKGVLRRVMEMWIVNWEKGNFSTDIERIRSGLSEAVLDAERSRGSAILWRIYVELELRMKNFKKAKSLLYQAIRSCPLVKEFYLLAFGPLRAYFSSYELRSFADTMAERGIRMRGDLEEFLQSHQYNSKTEGRSDESDQDSGDEIEKEARERRRLMPY